jgi:hypothetical protein
MIGKESRTDDLEYFRNRALQEQLAATNAQSPEARRRHDELAMMYRFKAAMLSSSPDMWSDSLGDERQPEPA